MESTGATRTVPKIDTSCHVHASVAIPYSRATSEYSSNVRSGEIAIPIRKVPKQPFASSPCNDIQSHIILTTVQTLLYNTFIDIQNGVVFKSVLLAPGKVKISSRTPKWSSSGEDSLKEQVQTVMSDLGPHEKPFVEGTYYRVSSSHFIIMLFSSGPEVM